MPVASANPPQLITLYQWGGINQSATRNMIEDQELYWCENLFPTAVGQLRAGYGPSAPIYTAPYGTSILRIFCTNIDGVNPLGFMFLSDGTVVQVNLNDGSTVGLGQIWAPQAPHYYADVKLWMPSQYGYGPGQGGGLVIGSPQGLYAWDGATLTGPGQTPPLWLTDNQTVDANNNPLTMPTGLPGIYAMEVYQQRLWVMGKTVTAFSAPSNGADFSTNSGGGAFGYYGSQLTVSYVDLATSQGFLFLFGDSCINVISNLQLVGQGTVYSPFTTAFQLAGVDPQNGQRFFRPVGHWGNAFILFNGAGIFGFSGQQATLISPKIINLFATLDPNAFEPTMAPCDIHGRRWMLFNGSFRDPWGVRRSMMLCWDGSLWFVASQNLNLTHIMSYEQNSSISAYGTDGQSLYRLFARPDNLLPKRLATKTYKGQNLLTIKQWNRIFLEMRDRHPPLAEEGVTVTGSLNTSDGGIVNGSEDISFYVPPGGAGVIPHPTNGAGIGAWADLQSMAPDFVIERLHLTYDERTLFGA